MTRQLSDDEVVKAACDELRERDEPMRAKEIASRLRAKSIAIEKSDVSRVLHAAAIPQLKVAEDGSGYWRYVEAAARPQAFAPPPPEPPQPSAPVAFNLSEEQRVVVEAEVATWLLVEAGPGTGKTAVACARVAHLLQQGVAPSAILLVSFTRTAVAELRTRIWRLSGNAAGAAAVRISTLDSEAWHLNFGLGEGGLAQDFEHNIEQAIELLRARKPEVLDWFEKIQHLIVDEAQDLVGPRAELVIEMLDRLGPRAGATIFLDPAQAIYGFSSDLEDDTETAEAPFQERLLDEFGESFAPHRLTHLFRTNSPALRSIFEQGRQVAMASDESAQRLEQLEALARQLAERVGAVDKRSDLAPSELVLFRRRSEALMVSSFLSGRGVAHRLRMSHLPLCIHPWVGILFSETTERNLSRTAFARRWAEVATLPQMRGLEESHCWDLLERTAGESAGRVDLSQLRKVLARSRPPAEFLTPEVGLQGPIVGTIHASKGRESDVVTLMLPTRTPPSQATSGDLDEEVRVAYVGATRARHLLKVGSAARTWARGLGGPGGRVHALDRDAKAVQFESGREGDVNVRSVVDRVETRNRAGARELQHWLAALDGRHHEATARQGEADFSYRIEVDGKRYVCLLEQAVNSDLFKMGDEMSPGALRPPDEIRHLYLFGSRTVAVKPDDAQLSRLAEPYATSGFFLAPLIKGFTKVWLQYRNRKGGRS